MRSRRWSGPPSPSSPSTTFLVGASQRCGSPSYRSQVMVSPVGSACDASTSTPPQSPSPPKERLNRTASPNLLRHTPSKISLERDAGKENESSQSPHYRSANELLMQLHQERKNRTPPTARMLDGEMQSALPKRTAHVRFVDSQSTENDPKCSAAASEFRLPSKSLLERGEVQPAVPPKAVRPLPLVSRSPNRMTPPLKGKGNNGTPNQTRIGVIETKLKEPKKPTASKSSREAVRCAKQVVSRMAHNVQVLRVYFRRWQRVATRHRSLEAVTIIRRSSETRLAQHVLYAWLLLAVRKQAMRRLASIRSRTHVALLRRYLVRMARWVHHKREQKKRVQALQPIAVEANCALAHRSIEHWAHVARTRNVQRAMAMKLLDVNIDRLMFVYFHVWKRRRFRAIQLQLAGRMQRSILRDLAKRRLQLWELHVSRRIISVNLEQFHFRSICARHMVRWRKYARVHRQLRQIAHDSLWRVARGSFLSWQRWLLRRVLALRLEHNNLQLLLRSFFQTWVTRHRSRSLSYLSYVSSKTAFDHHHLL